jgi:hypothetical protein
MENTISHFQVDGLEIKLTEEKIFINTAASNEAFALRSIDGIGVIDLVDQYNHSMNFYKSELTNLKIAKFGAILFVIIFIIGVGMYLNDNIFLGIFFGLIGIIFCSIMLIMIYNSNIKLPTLKSAVRIMMSGGNRDFTFDKADTNSQNIAEFVAKVENTLTAFHKKNA